MHCVFGTAGHIDHGKSALVRALTGTDPDRLKEEKERGMTTDLGFAFLGEDITFIDVPGHERFVRHMLAGASTIDVVVLVVAADDGVMPQTREHFEICRLMGIRRGIVAITKADLADDEWLELVRQDVAELVAGSFLEDAPVAVVSSVTGQGVAELRRLILEVAGKTEPKPDRGVFRLQVDRSFTIKGFGTVVAGTVLSGRCRVGDRIELLPQQRPVKVRGIQRHNQLVEEVSLGDRAALNLQGVEREAVERGCVLATPGYYTPTACFNGALSVLTDLDRPLRNMTRMRLHVGTAEVLGRVVLLDAREIKPGQEGLIQFRLESALVCDWNDRFVVRSYSPQNTVGGGIVLEPVAAKERRFDDTALARLRALAAGDTETLLEQHLLKYWFEARPETTVARELALADEDTARLCSGLEAKGRLRRFRHEGREYLVHSQGFEKAQRAVLDALEEYHRENPARLGVKRAELRLKAGPNLSVPLFDELLSGLQADGSVVRDHDRLRLAGHEVKLKPDEQEQFDRAASEFRSAGFSPPALDEVLAGTSPTLREKVRTALFESGVLVDVGEAVVMHQDVIEEARRRVVAMFATSQELTASEVRQQLGTSRRYCIPLLNYFDSLGLTQRRGDKRVLRQSVQEDKAGDQKRT